jgi:hypothetical protein
MVSQHSRADHSKQGELMSGKAVLENVRRYRAIASLYRQTAAFRPLQKWSLLDQAEEWERLAVKELETYFNRAHDLQPSANHHTDEPWARLAAA